MTMPTKDAYEQRDDHERYLLHRYPKPRALPSLYCHVCRRWVVTRDKHNVFESIEGRRLPVTVWVCPGCAGEGGSNL